MKKLINFSVIALTVSMVIFSCEKRELTTENVPSKEQNTENESTDNNLKAEGATSCSVACFWSSCSVTCAPNLGAAACTCVSIWGGLLGSSATCACAGVGVSTTSRVSFSDDHIERYNILIDIISDSGLNSERVILLKDVAEKIVKHGTKNGNAFGKKRVLLEEFLERANNLERQEAEHIGIELRQKPRCSSLTPMNELNY